ncbi:MAG TPA: hypothetical protein VK563_16825 [Puia sp.]|nr:hypothetical protein [Puia sp.]
MTNTYLSRIADRAVAPVAGPSPAVRTVMSPAGADAAVARPPAGTAEDPFTDAANASDLLPAQGMGQEPVGNSRHSLVPEPARFSDAVNSRKTGVDTGTAGASAEMRTPYITRHVERMVAPGGSGLPSANPSPRKGLAGSAGTDPSSASDMCQLFPGVAKSSDAGIVRASTHISADPLGSAASDAGSGSLTDKDDRSDGMENRVMPAAPTGRGVTDGAVIAGTIAALARIQPLLQPSAVMAPTHTKKENPAPKLVIGKITVEIVAPSKPQRTVRRVSPASPAATISSFRKPSFGLGQL